MQNDSPLFSLKRFLALSFILLLPLSSGVASPSLGLNEIITQVWKTSPLLEAQETQTSLAHGDRYRRFIFNEPQFVYANTDDNTGQSFGLSLSTAFPGKTFAFSQIDTAKSHAQNAESFAKKYDLTRTLVQAYLDCAAAQASDDLQTQTSADFETIFQSLKSLYESGHSTQAEKIGAELQSKQARLDLRTAHDRVEVACKKLDLLLTKQGTSPFQFGKSKIELPDDIDASIVSELGTQTSDQNRSLASIEVAQASASTSVWAQLPDLNLNVNRNHYLYLPGSPSGKEWTTSFGVSITVPLLFPFHETVEAKRAKSQAVIDENLAQIQKASADSDQLDGAREYQRSRARLHELRTHDLSLAEALVESTYSAYRAGKLGYAELVLSRRTLSDLRAQDIALRVSTINSHLRCLHQCDENLNPLDKESNP